ncbi:hypothetical protein BD779DRAFT_437830 [Infundibulicybe gibba]|nr:hypothetical protein BD779DRAFT_437830 [Infundibulicybe gibba]
MQEQIEKQVKVLRGATEKLGQIMVRVEGDLSNLGLGRGRLLINRELLAQRLKDNVCNLEPSRKMILEAILLTVAEISADTGVPVIIFPKMQVADEDGINVVNPATGFQLCLTGDTDFGICTYKTEAHQFFMLTAADNSAMKFAHVVLRLLRTCPNASACMTTCRRRSSQAIALSERKRKKAVRFCISDGLNWVLRNLGDRRAWKSGQLPRRAV